MPWLLPRAPRPAPLLRLTEPSGPLTAVAAHPDGQRVITGSSAGQLAVRRLADGTEEARFTAPGPISALCFLPDGALCLSASVRGQVMLWTLSGQPLAAYQDHRGPIHGMCLLGERLLVTCGADHRVHFRDLHTGEVMALPRQPAALSAAAEQGGWLVACGTDGAVQVWSPDGGAPTRFSAHAGAIRCCTVCPDGTILTAGEGGVVRGWGRDGSPRFSLEGHEGAVRALAVSSDGRHLLSGGDDQRVLAWDLQQQAAVGAFDGHERPVAGLAWLPGTGRAISAAADRSAQVWDVGALPPAWPRPMRHRRSVRACVVTGPSLVSASRDATLQVWDLPSGQRRHQLGGHTGAVQDLAVSADQSRLASVSTDGQIRTWDIAQGRLLQQIDDPRGPLACCAFWGRDRLWVGAIDGSVCAWSLPEGTPDRQWAAHSDRVRGCAVHPDGDLLATVSYDHTGKLWSLPDGACRATLTGHTGAVVKVAFSPDRRWLATGALDGTVRLWDPRTGDRLRVLSGHTAGVSGLVFAQEGLISTAKDGQVRLWDPRTGACLRHQTLSEPLDAVAVWPRGLIAGGVSGNIWVMQHQA